MKRHWKALLGFGLSAFLIWFTLRGVDLVQVWQEVRVANPYLLASSIFVILAGYLFRAARWRVLLHPVDPNTGFGNRLKAVVIGFAITNLIPARVGEFARAYTLGRLEPRVSVSAAFGSLVVERVMDGLVLGGFLVAAVFSPGFPELAPESGLAGVLRGAMSLVAILLAVLLGFLFAPGPVIAAVNWVGRFLPKGAGRLLNDVLAAFLDSLDVVRSPVLLLLGFGWTLAFWLFHGLSFHLAMLAFGIDEGFVAALFTEAVVGFGVALPAAPGFFGTFHVSAQFALERVYGADPASTLAFAYGYHIGGFIPITLIGLWLIRSVGFSLSEMAHSEEAVEEAVEASTAGATPAERRPAGAGGPVEETGETSARTESPSEGRQGQGAGGPAPDDPRGTGGPA